MSTALGARSVLQGAAQAGRRLVAVGERGLILVSSDDGQSWQQRPCPVSTGLTAVRFADDLHGVAVGHGGVVLSTQDGGQQWRLVLEGLQAARLEREAARARGDAAALRSAERLVADGADKPWLDVLTSAPGRLLAVGAYGLALASGDGGLTWTSWRDRLDNPRELHLYGVRQRGERLLIAGEQGLVLLSGDGGRSFRRLVLPYAGSFFTAELPPDGSLVVAGLRGNTWRSTDGGASWQALAAPVPVSIVASALAPDGALLLASQAGQVLRAAPGELALRALPLPPQPPLTGLLPLAGGRLLTLSILGARRLSLSDAVAPAPH
ncbi:WD40/YVTN/BNR-like repeat-containing protein [Sphaerotilus hippei]|uniref:WD40/YVTN/BNR-like repeat-containing protein n=1 Tax=Sphaerotilus hippei TaxID=744406 RepID=UPI001B86CF54|nr:YCF48-related protein [Sphaerotilus hippei]